MHTNQWFDLFVWSGLLTVFALTFYQCLKLIWKALEPIWYFPWHAFPYKYFFRFRIKTHEGMFLKRYERKSLKRLYALKSRMEQTVIFQELFQMRPNYVGYFRCRTEYENLMKTTDFKFCEWRYTPETEAPLDRQFDPLTEMSKCTVSIKREGAS